MRRTLIAAVISAGMLAGCASSSGPKVVGTFCAHPIVEDVTRAIYGLGVHYMIYDDGSVEVMKRPRDDGLIHFYGCES